MKKKYVQTEEHKRKNRIAHFGEKNPRWVNGIPTSKTGIHIRMYKKYGKANHCENLKCSKNCKRFDWSNKRHDYKSLERDDWQMLCKSCHQQYDMKHNNRQRVNAELALF